MKILWLDTVDSTNNEVKRRFSALENPTAVAALSQTAGKGQRGNRWSAAPGENLTFSVGVSFGEKFPPVAADRQFRISMAAALAVCDFLRELGIPAMIKWPNDIYVGDKKICGILIENTLRTASVDRSVIGIGLNVNQRDFPPELINPTSIALIVRRSYDINECLSLILGKLEYNLSRINELKDRYLASLYRKGESREYRDCDTGEIFKATILGVNEEGRLEVGLQDGLVKSFAFKEIGYII